MFAYWKTWGSAWEHSPCHARREVLLRIQTYTRSPLLPTLAHAFAPPPNATQAAEELADAKADHEAALQKVAHEQEKAQVGRHGGGLLM